MKTEKTERLSYFFIKELKNGLTITKPINNIDLALKCFKEELPKLKIGDTISVRATNNFYNQQKNK